jgi:hypothetical protein
MKGWHSGKVFTSAQHIVRSCQQLDNGMPSVPTTTGFQRAVAYLGLEGMAELGDERQEDGAAEAQRMRVGRCAVFQQAEAQVMLDAISELLAGCKHAAAVLQQHFKKLQRQHLQQEQASCVLANCGI